VIYQNTLEFAQAQDNNDQLNNYKEQFYHPIIDGKDVLYFTGHSLGLQPKTVYNEIKVELDRWAQLGVEGYFRGTPPWVSCCELLTPIMARLVGAKNSEVVCMNTLTTNLHLLFASFYRPTKQRYKIICEDTIFSTDRYVLETQVLLHGFDPNETIIEVAPREGEHLIREEDILDTITKHGEEIAMVFFGGVNYLTGQFFNLDTLTKAAHNVGAYAGFDLAHAVGNLPLKLHDWNVDFAAWCSYKYLNGGPANIAGIFINEKHFELPRLGGWWGSDKETRFNMEKYFSPMASAEGWQLSNASVIGVSMLKASLDIFDQAGIDNLRKKSIELTGYLEFVINHYANKSLQIITPKEVEQRGCQLSIKLIDMNRTFRNAEKFLDTLAIRGVVVDYRKPDIIRVAPVPLYNSFQDIFYFGKILKENTHG